jgi:hypothetical protein
VNLCSGDLVLLILSGHGKLGSGLRNDINLTGGSDRRECIGVGIAVLPDPPDNLTGYFRGRYLQLAQWSRLFFEKLTVGHLVKKYLVFLRIGRFIAVFTRAHY